MNSSYLVTIEFPYESLPGLTYALQKALTDLVYEGDPAGETAARMLLRWIDEVGTGTAKSGPSVFTLVAGPVV